MNTELIDAINADDGERVRQAVQRGASLSEFLPIDRKLRALDSHCLIRVSRRQIHCSNWEPM
jgi:hypothetical protein